MSPISPADGATAPMMWNTVFLSSPHVCLFPLLVSTVSRAVAITPLWLLSTQVRVFLLAHHLFTAFLFLSRMMTILEIRTMVINQRFSPVLPSRVLTIWDPHVHLCLHPAEGATQVLCCPHLVSSMSLVEGATMVSRVCLAGEIAQMQHPSDSLFHLLTHVLMLTHKSASKKGRQWWLRKDHSTQVQVSLLVHPLTDNFLPTVQERWHRLLFLSFLPLPGVSPPRAMTNLEIRTSVINHFSRLFPTPVSLLHVTINLERRTAQHTSSGRGDSQGPLFLLCLGPVLRLCV